MSKKEGALVPFKEYTALAGADAGEMLEIMKENFEGVQISARDLEVIKFPSGGQLAWELEKDGDTVFDKDFQAIILSIVSQRVFFATSIEDGGGNTPPDCYSEDAIQGVGDPGGPCAGCQNTKFGSASNGAGQACTDQRMLAILRPGAMLPSMLRVPPTSIQKISEFMRLLSSASKRRSGVITRFGLETAQNAAGIEYGRLTLSIAGQVPDDQVEKVKAFSLSMAGVIENFGPAVQPSTGEQEVT